MSYDIRLKDPVTDETLHLPFQHIMVGGTYAADYDPKTGTFSPMPIDEATLNITYNYAPYYYEFLDKERGIRVLNGMTGLDSRDLLQKAIQEIEGKYKRVDGTWIETEREVTEYFDSSGNLIPEADCLYAMLHGESDKYTKTEKKIMVSEGDAKNYWQATAANALRPLYQLLVFASARPDGVWECD